MHRIALSLAATLAALTLAPWPVPARAAELHIEDTVFLLYAAELDRTQVRLGQLASEKAQDEQVRQFARRMIDYHEQSNRRKGSARSPKGCRIGCSGYPDHGSTRST